MPRLATLQEEANGIPIDASVVKMQKGILLRAANHAISETPVPRPPADYNDLDTAVYASLLKARGQRTWHSVHHWAGGSSSNGMHVEAHSSPTRVHA